MSQKRAYKSYTKEFKEEAVALITDQGYSVPEAASALGVSVNLLYKWKQNFDVLRTALVNHTAYNYWVDRFSNRVISTPILFNYRDSRYH